MTFGFDPGSRNSSSGRQCHDCRVAHHPRYRLGGLWPADPQGAEAVTADADPPYVLWKDTLPNGDTARVTITRTVEAILS